MHCTLLCGMNTLNMSLLKLQIIYQNFNHMWWQLSILGAENIWVSVLVWIKEAKGNDSHLQGGGLPTMVGLIVRYFWELQFLSITFSTFNFFSKFQWSKVTSFYDWTFRSPEQNKFWMLHYVDVHLFLGWFIPSLFHPPDIFIPMLDK